MGCHDMRMLQHVNVSRCRDVCMYAGQRRERMTRQSKFNPHPKIKRSPPYNFLLVKGAPSSFFTNIGKYKYKYCFFTNIGQRWNRNLPLFHSTTPAREGEVGSDFRNSKTQKSWPGLDSAFTALSRLSTTFSAGNK